MASQDLANKTMYRLTLPRLHKSVDTGKCLPAGDRLPSWSNLPLDAKFPMVPTPKGTLTLFTTKCCAPKYRRYTNTDFDLTDPNGMSMSSVYHPLHDPHLTAHFSVGRMRKHLVRNGFITESGMVICNLREFNKYRQYLRRLFLTELNNERRRENLRDDANRTPQHKAESRMSTRYFEAKQMQTEKIEKCRMKLQIAEKQKTELMERRKDEERERHAEYMKKKQEDDDKRRDTLMRYAMETERKNLKLIQKWRRNDREFKLKMEGIREQRVLDLQRRIRHSWLTRKRTEQSRIEKEAVIRDVLNKQKEQDVCERDRSVSRQRGSLLSKIDQLKTTYREAKQNRDKLHADRLARRIEALSRREQRRRNTKSARTSFVSEWTLPQVLLEPTAAERSQKFIQMLTDAIDDAIVNVKSETHVEDTPAEHDMRHFASNLIQTIVSTVKREAFPAYSQEPGALFDMEEGICDDSYQSDLDEELAFTLQTSDESSFEDMRNRAVKFNFDESIIPMSRDNLYVSEGGLKPVSEHRLTPAPSPLPCETSSEFDFRVKLESKGEDSLAESLITRLLEDINNERVDRDDLVKLSAHCIDFAQLQAGPDNAVRSSSSTRAADAFVSFTLSKIKEDVKSGMVDKEDLTALTEALLRASEKAESDEEEFRILLSRTLSAAVKDQDQDEHELPGDWMVEDFVAKTLAQVQRDMKDGQLTEEEIKEIGSAVVISVIDDATADESVMSEDKMKKTLNRILKVAETDTFVGPVLDKVITAIVTSYHTLAGKEEKTAAELIEDFLIDVLSQVSDDIADGHYTEPELRQMLNKDLAKLGGADVRRHVQNIIENVLDELDSGKVSEREIMDIGKVLVETGKRLLAARGVPATSTQGKFKGMQDKELTEKLVKEVLHNVQIEMDDERFEKEALKALAASFLKASSSRDFEGASARATIGSSRNLSELSTRKQPSPTDSTLAADIVLATMDKMSKDLRDNCFPVSKLPSIAGSVVPQSDDAQSVFISEDIFESDLTSLQPHLKMPLLEIVRLLREEEVSPEEAKRMFSVILQNYLSRDDPHRTVSLDSEESRLVEELIGATMKTLVRNVTEEVRGMTITVTSDKGSVSQLDMSNADLENYVWDTLNSIGREASMHSVSTRPLAPVPLRSCTSVNPENLESLIRGTLTQVARDIAGNVVSHTCLPETSQNVDDFVSSAMELNAKVIEFVISVLSELVVGLERGKVSKTSVVQFMEDVCPGQDFKNMEIEKLHMQLKRVMSDVKRKGTSSPYFHAIAKKFTAIKALGEEGTPVMSPELQEIGGLLANVDGGILTQFIQATLLTVLGGMHLPPIDSSTFRLGSINELLKSESSLLARKLVDNLITRIQKDVDDGLITLDEATRKNSALLASRVACSLVTRIQEEIFEGSQILDDDIKLKMLAKYKNAPKPSFVSTGKGKHAASKRAGQKSHESAKDFSTYVLDTLKSVVSNLLRAESVSGGKTPPVSVSKGCTSMLEEFIFKHLQLAVDSITTGESKGKTSDQTTAESVSQMTKRAASFVLNILLSVVVDMIVENEVNELELEEFLSKEKERADKVDTVSVAKEAPMPEPKKSQNILPTAVSSEELTKYILSSLKQVLSGYAVGPTDQSAQQEYLKDPGEHNKLMPNIMVKIASASGTTCDASEQVHEQIPSIQSTRSEQVMTKTQMFAPPFSQKHASFTGINDLVAEVISQTIENVKSGKLSATDIAMLEQSVSREDAKGSSSTDVIVDALESAKTNIKEGAVSMENIQTVTQQIATLSVEKSDGDTKHEESFTSLHVQSLIKDVIGQIVETLSGDDADQNDNKFIASSSSGLESEGVISDLANLSIGDWSFTVPDVLDMCSNKSTCGSSVSAGSKTRLVSDTTDEVVTDASSKSSSAKMVRASKTVSGWQRRQRRARNSNTSIEGSTRSTEIRKKPVQVGCGIPAIKIDSSSVTSSSSSGVTAPGEDNTQDNRRKRVLRKPQVAVTDTSATSSDQEASGHPGDVTQIRSVCGSHTTRVTVRGSQEYDDED